MGRLFGTDGIRGVVNQDLTGELAYRVGKAAAQVLAKETTHAPRFVIGRDTRISGTMLEAALAAGLTSAGAEVCLLGVVPTPAVAYITVQFRFDAGIMVSASHNPFEHNGIKIFNHEGFKLSDALEEAVEALVLGEIAFAEPVIGENLGVVRHSDGSELSSYIEHLAHSIQNPGSLRLLIDCANGSASATAQRLFAHFPSLQCDFLAVSPDGKNINDHCGSTHLNQLAEKVVSGGYDMGIAFDGDADRCLCVDETGAEIDGDKMIAACAEQLRRDGALAQSTIVATVMSNIGLHRYCQARDLKLICTVVGDRNVLECMLAHGYSLGGEQSGHMIFLAHATTGDGQLSALQFLQVLATEQSTAHEVAQRCAKYPQVLKNLTVSSKEERERKMNHPALASKIAQAEASLEGNGRVLIRPSGTEALIRVMVEAQEASLAEELTNELLTFIENI